MSLLGIDVGTTGCKVAVFSEDGTALAVAYSEYDYERPRPGWAELIPEWVWARIKELIRQAAASTNGDPISAVSVSSLGEAMVPVGRDGGVLGPSLLNFDTRGNEYLPELAGRVTDARLYHINGNTLGANYGLTKLLWLRDNRPQLYAQTWQILLWGPFISFKLGAEPFADHSLANRTLLFDIEKATWSDELLCAAGIDAGKLPPPVAPGTVVGHVTADVADELGLPRGAAIVAGAHDQCANAVGCGVLHEGAAMYGLGTYACIVPVFNTRPAEAPMMAGGLNTEHHAAPGRWVCFVYNAGGALVKWHRDTFAAADRDTARRAGGDVYGALMAEMPDAPTGLMLLPHFAATGPPYFASETSGVLAGLRLETPRGEILKGVLEGITYYMREALEYLPATVKVEEFTAVGGGSKSDAWLQLSADILGRPLVRPKQTEAGALGAAILAGTATGAFSSVEDGVTAMVRTDRRFEPRPELVRAYDERYALYRRMWPLLKDYLAGLSRLRSGSA